MNKKTLFLLKLSVFFVFIGRAWQHLFWDAPYRSFFWDESLLRPIVEQFLSITWHEYATSSTTDGFIQKLILINGLVYTIAAIATISIGHKLKRWQNLVITIGGISLIALTILMTKEKFYHGAQFFEHSIQFGLPFCLLYFYSEKYNTLHYIVILKALIAITFVSHGLYAFGIYPVPGNFVDMVIQIFNCSEETALTFLYIAGILDFLLAFLIFIPVKFISIAALYYAVFWGLLTAFARIAANFQIDYPLLSLHQYLYQVVYRLGHGLVPLAVIYLLKARLSSSDTIIKTILKKVP